MATHSTRPTQDQNFRVHEVKTNVPVFQKNKGGKTGGRKALIDISNSEKPSALQPSRKHNKKINAVPIGEDLGVSKKAQIPASGRKALADVTNSVVKPSAQQLQVLTKKCQGKQSIAFADDENLPFSIAEEGFLHNHDECIKQQKKSMDIDFDDFLKIIGLDASSVSMLSDSIDSPTKDEINPFMGYELDEIPVPVIEDQARGGQSSPICGSPDCTWPSVMDYDDIPSFELIESPKKSK